MDQPKIEPKSTKTTQQKIDEYVEKKRREEDTIRTILLDYYNIC